MDNSDKRIFITGTAGFIGFHLADRFLRNDWEVLGLDGLTPYYDVNLKIDRNRILQKNENYNFIEGMLEDKDVLENIVNDFSPSVVVHLAAQAGVRYSIENPESYVKSNLTGTSNILEVVRNRAVKHLILASTSSVYGGNLEMPYREIQKTEKQMSFYAATKKSNELMSHAYSHLFGIPTTCLRFFTVYGPWGRPDMALFKFTDAILNNKPIQVYNNGNMVRDFTYIGDLVEAIIRISAKIPKIGSKINRNDSLSEIAPWRVVNIGSSNPKKLLYFIETLETILGKKAEKKFLSLQDGDVPETSSDCSLLHELTNYVPNTELEFGIKKFVEWYHNYFSLENSFKDEI